jgi:hypothetical protein
VLNPPPGDAVAVKGRISLLICELAATSLLTSACGGSSGSHPPPPSCLQAQPCGGDVVGTWSFQGGCSNLPAANADLQASCPGGSLAALGITFSGFLTFNSDLSYTGSSWHETFNGLENATTDSSGQPMILSDLVAQRATP